MIASQYNLNLYHCFHYNLFFAGAFKSRCKNLTLSWNLLKSYQSKKGTFPYRNPF